MKSLFRTLPLALFLALPVLAEDAPQPEPKKNETKDSGEAKKAIADGMAKLDEKSYNFSAKLDLEMGGSPMLNTEVKGTHKKPYTKMGMEMMGQAMEIWTDGKSTVQKNPQTGGLEKTENNMTASFDPNQIAKVIKSAKWDDKESKVGSHVCRVAKATVDKDKISKMMAKGGMGGQAKISKSSLKFYIDKEDGKIRRWKLSMTMSVDMGGGGQGGMELDVVMDQRISYSSKATVDLPDEVKKLFEEKTESDPNKDEKEKEKDGVKDEDEDEGSDK